MNKGWKLTVLGAFYFVIQFIGGFLESDSEGSKKRVIDVILISKDVKSGTERKEDTLGKLFKEKQKDLLNLCKIYEQNEDKNASQLSGEFFFSTDNRFNQQVHLKSFLLDDKRKTMYCWNRKVASSFWTWTFSEGVRDINDATFSKPHKISNKMSPKTLSAYGTAVSSYQNIIVVRHPLVRLVSAYRDRVAGLKASVSFYRSVARSLQITQLDRKIHYTVRKAVPGSNKTVPVRYWKKIFVPTWPQFLTYLMKTNTSQDVSF